MFSPLFSQISLTVLLDFAFQTSAYFGFSNTLWVRGISNMEIACV